MTLESPISQMIHLSGEPVALQAPNVVAPYNPNDPADLVPATPVTVNTRGIPAAPEMILAVGATDGVTILPACLPDGFAPQTATVTWHDTTWRVIKVRRRYWLGKLSGYTLFLVA